MTTQVPGTRVRPAVEPGDAATREALMGIVTPHLSDNMQRQAGMLGLTAYHGGGKLVGTALTVRTRPGDNLYIYQAMLHIQPGHVLVVDAGGALENAVLGELMKRYLQLHGCAGVVVDGAIRDVAAFARDDFPCYARGATHRGPFKDGPGEVNVPVVIGGQVIQPGDWIVGDEDGLVAFAPEHAPALIEAAHAHAAKEARILAEIETGIREQSWMTAAFKAKGLA